MDPQAAIDEFNSPLTARVERVYLAEGLLQWLRSGGFRPKGKFDPEIIKMLRDRFEEEGARAAEMCNEILSR